jgi:O-antigen/teichoic acid export membrane protein
VLTLFVNAGMPVANVYFSGSRRISLEALAPNASAFALIGTVAAALLIGIAAAAGVLSDIVPGLSSAVIALSIVLLGFTLIDDSFSALLQGRHNIRAVNLVDLFQGTVSLAGMIVFLVILGGGEVSAMVAYCAAGFSALIATGTLLRRRFNVSLLPRWRRSVASETARFGIVGNAANIMQFLIYRLDAFIVNIVIGASAVGLYAVATRLAELLWLLPNAVAFVIFPRAASLGKEEMNKFTPKVVGATLAAGAAGGVVLLVGGPLFVRVLFGAQYKDAYPALAALLPGAVLLGPAIVLGNEIAGRARPGLNAINALIGLAIIVPLDIWLIPAHGIVGAGAASSVAYTVNLVLAVTFYLRVSGTPFGEFVWPWGRAAEAD